jgi:hypothetical protein
LVVSDFAGAKNTRSVEVDLKEGEPPFSGESALGLAGLAGLARASTLLRNVSFALFLDYHHSL